MWVSLAAGKNHQRCVQTDKEVETTAIKIVEIIMIFGCGQGKKENDDRIFQIDMELGSKRL